MRRPTGVEGWAAAWTVLAVVNCHRQLGAAKVSEVALPSATRFSAAGGQAVPAVLRRLRCRCLVTALVHQAWRADHGDPLDVVIGVTSPSAGFTAHAWLDDDGNLARGGAGFEPLHRVGPRRPQR